jgi:hypothetical protein
LRNRTQAIAPSADIMTDIAISVFSVSNRRGYFLPALNVHYQETDGPHWTIVTGGTRAYVVRFGTPLIDDPEEQSADSHFMMRRVTSALLLGGVGLFHAETSGRLFIRNVQGDISWTSYFDWPAPDDQPGNDAAGNVNDWFGAFTKHAMLRRAADDAHAALSSPHEALTFAYRALEWIVVGRGVSWDALATEIGAPVESLRELKKAANVDLGFRHATSTGVKARADLGTAGSAVALVFDAVNASRVRLEPGFKPMTPTESAGAIIRTLSPFPYP